MVLVLISWYLNILTSFVPLSLFKTIIPYFYTSFAKLEHQHCHTILSFFGGTSEKFAVPTSVFKR